MNGMYRLSDGVINGGLKIHVTLFLTCGEGGQILKIDLVIAFIEFVLGFGGELMACGGMSRFLWQQGAGWDKTGLGGIANGTANIYGHVSVAELIFMCVVCRNLHRELVK